MDLDDVLHSWKSQQDKAELTLKMNKKLLEHTIYQKTESALQPLIKLKTTSIIVTVPYILILAAALFFALKKYDSSKSYFVVSVAAIFLVNIKALIDYVKDLSLAKNINYNDTVVKVQQQLSALQFATIKHAKTMCLQFPFFTTFYLSNKWFPGQVGLGYMVFQLALTGAFTYATYWLYKNHTIENINKKWFRNMIAGSGGKSVLKAIEFYKELEEFKK